MSSGVEDWGCSAQQILFKFIRAQIRALTGSGGPKNRLRRYSAWAGFVDGKYLFHLYPSRDCVWEIRSVRSEPSIRVLGFLASRDIFVATTYALREALGGWQSRECKQIKRRAGAQWRPMFDPYPPLPGTDPTKHVSGVLSGKFFETRG